MLNEKQKKELAQERIKEECDSIKELLLNKNAKYGNSALEPARVFSRASATEQILVRIDDKVSRLHNNGWQADEMEDTVKDLIGYLILLRVADDWDLCVRLRAEKLARAKQTEQEIEASAHSPVKSMFAPFTAQDRAHQAEVAARAAAQAEVSQALGAGASVHVAPDVPSAIRAEAKKLADMVSAMQGAFVQYQLEHSVSPEDLELTHRTTVDEAGVTTVHFGVTHKEPRKA